VHLAHDVGHGVEGGVVGVDDQVYSVVEDVQLGVGDEDRDLDQGILAQVEACHLAVDPHQVVRHARELSPGRLV
jgi:hypothetical protein